VFSPNQGAGANPENHGNMHQLKGVLRYMHLCLLMKVQENLIVSQLFPTK